VKQIYPCVLRNRRNRRNREKSTPDLIFTRLYSSVRKWWTFAAGTDNFRNQGENGVDLIQHPTLSFSRLSVWGNDEKAGKHEGFDKDAVERREVACARRTGTSATGSGSSN